MMDKQSFVEREFLRRGMMLPGAEPEAGSEESFCAEWFRAENDDSPLTETELRYQELAERDAASGKMPIRQWKRPARRKPVEEQFLRQYRLYLSGGDGETLLNDLIRLLGQLCTYVIYDRISGLSVYQSGDEEDITQEGHEAVFEKLLEDRLSCRERGGALYYYTGIYRKKTMDYLRFYGLLADKKRDDKESAHRRRTGVKKSDINSAGRMEDMMTGPDGEDMSDRCEAFSVAPFEDYAALDARQSRGILRVYLRELMDNANYPAAPLAVMYARILYQMERLLDPARIEKMVARYMEKKNWSAGAQDQHYDTHLVKATQEIQKYTTATSPIWAMERMGGMSIGALALDSETSVHVNFDASLRWGPRFTGQLSQTAAGLEPAVWADVIYTAVYGKAQIENWAADIHNATVIKAARIIVRDANLLEYVMDECDDEGRLKKEIRKRIQRNRKREGVCR